MDRKTGEQTVESGEAAALSCSCSSPGTHCHKTIKDVETDSAACCRSGVRDRE